MHIKLFSSPFVTRNIQPAQQHPNNTKHKHHHTKQPASKKRKKSSINNRKTHPRRSKVTMANPKPTLQVQDLPPATAANQGTDSRYVILNSDSDAYVVVESDIAKQTTTPAPDKSCNSDAEVIMESKTNSKDGAISGASVNTASKSDSIRSPPRSPW
jgi:hypothetical protein